MNPETLKAMFLFELFSPEQLGWLIANSEVQQCEGGAWLFREGQPTDALWVLIDGQMQFTRTVSGRAIELETSETPGNWGGWLPMFDKAPMTLAARVTRPSQVLRIPSHAVQHMLDHGFPITQHLLNGMFYGVQNFEALTRQQEKLAALGRLSAGLAHELNNPATAARRAAQELDASLHTLHERLIGLCRLGAPADALARLVDLEQQARAHASQAQPLGPLEQSDREDAVATLLEEHGVGESWDYAATLVGAGLDEVWLQRAVGQVPGVAAGDLIGWLAASLSVHGLVREVEQSTGRISQLVGAVKSYSYMDQANVQEIDIHEGIESTLTMLQHKLKHGVTVVRKYDRSLPRLTAYAGELNQVWTNLIDNAVDAMDGQGTLTITTGRDETCLMVEIADTGPGVPADLQSRVFEPFFTTKAQGKGTGLGLDIAYRIVSTHHSGTIKLQSRPGETRFQVWLPFEREG